VLLRAFLGYGRPREPAASKSSLGELIAMMGPGGVLAADLGPGRS
jgi:hypothetical protein